MNKKRKEIIASNEISEMRSYVLNGISQKILIEGKRKLNPIVIFLHGGPGFPIPFCAGCRGMFPELTDQAVMVYWDQLGCGINDYIIDESFSINHYVNMTIELIEKIKADFPDNSINLLAVSWGSILAAKAVEAVPDLIDNVVIYGQVLKQIFFNDEVFEALEKSNMPSKHKAKLSVIKQTDEHGIEDLKIITRCIRKYTEGYQSKKGSKMNMGKIIRGFLRSPDYSLKNFKAIVVNGFMKNKSVLNELIKIDLTQTLGKVRVPYMILQGDTDIVTSTKLISSFVESAGNNNLHFHEIHNSGHIPSENGMNAVIQKGFKFFECEFTE